MILLAVRGVAVTLSSKEVERTFLALRLLLRWSHLLVKDEFNTTAPISRAEVWVLILAPAFLSPPL